MGTSGMRAGAVAAVLALLVAGCDKGEAGVSAEEKDGPKEAGATQTAAPAASETRPAAAPPPEPRGPLGLETASPTPAPPTPPAPEAEFRPPAPVAIGECTATSDSIGAYRPSTRDLVAAARAIPGATCIPPEHIAGALATCAAQVTSNTCEVAVTAPEFTACQHRVRSLEHAGRTWIKIGAFIGRGATFYAMVNILEIKNGAATLYYSGDEGGSDLCGGQPGQAQNTSAAMRADFASFPEHIRDDFFCGRAPDAGTPDPAAPEPAAAEPAADSPEQQALAFFMQEVRKCPAAASRAEGSRVVESRAGSIFVIHDGAGKHMKVHLSAKLIYGPGGPQGVMPRPYMNCKHTVFVGTMDH